MLGISDTTHGRIVLDAIALDNTVGLSIRCCGHGHAYQC